MSVRRFPVLGDHRWRHLNVPKSVPWSFVAPHEAQAQRNHGQSLERLAERGGLSPGEMVAVVEGKHWRDMPKTIELSLAR